MGLKGGYTIIDLSEAGSFTVGTAKTIPGIFGKINPEAGKACLLTGLVVGGTPTPDQWMNVMIAGANLLGVVGHYTLLFAANGAVTVNYYEPLNPPTLFPVANGTYTLKGTKTSSGFTYDWVKDT